MTNVHFEIINADDGDHTVLARFWSDLISSDMLCNNFNDDGTPKLHTFPDGVERLANTRLDLNIGVHPAISLDPNNEALREFVMERAPRQALTTMEDALAGTLRPASDAVGTVSSFQQLVVREVQMRLDAWARTRGYDGVLSACTYASSGVPKFAAEGQAAVDTRDASWAKCYEIMADVEAGTRPVPTLEEILSEMPALVWPE